jgi:hypothetical protein
VIVDRLHPIGEIAADLGFEGGTRSRGRRTAPVTWQARIAGFNFLHAQEVAQLNDVDGVFPLPLASLDSRHSKALLLR